MGDGKDVHDILRFVGRGDASGTEVKRDQLWGFALSALFPDLSPILCQPVPGLVFSRSFIIMISSRGVSHCYQIDSCFSGMGHS
jgi:hypothetical protein